MERWSLGLKSTGTRPVRPEEWSRVARMRRGFMMRAAKVGAGCLLWASGMPIMIAERERIQEFEGWALIVWGVGMFGVPIFTLRWLMTGWMRGIRLGRDLRGGFAEVLVSASTPGEEETEGATIEVLPASGLVLTENGVVSTGWVVAPIAAVVGPRRSVWLDFFDGKGKLDRTMRRELTQDERHELGELIKRTMRTPIQMWLGCAFLAVWMLSCRASFDEGIYEEEIARGSLLGMTILWVAIMVIPTIPRVRLALGLQRDLARNEVHVISFGESTRAQGAPESAEFLEESHRIWSAEGIPAPWRIVDELARH